MDVKEILEDKNIKYTARGRDYIIRCLNPEHEDVNPSLRVDKISGLFHCFSCGYAGDLFKHFNINKEKFIDIKAQQVLEKIKKLINKKSLGIPLDATYIKKDYRSINKRTLKEFGAFTTDELGLEGRIVFPIFDINGRIVSFHARFLYSDLDPKYKNYPENVSLPLYPAIVKPIENSIILVEGFFDMLNLHDKGLSNAVCTFGTSFGSVRKQKKRKENVDRLLQYKYQGIDRIFIMYDGDEAGRKAADNLKSYIGSIFTTETIDLDDGIDPGSMTEQQVIKLRGILYG